MKRLDEITARIEAATPGPWEEILWGADDEQLEIFVPNPDPTGSPWDTTTVAKFVDYTDCQECVRPSHPDATFIAAARTDLPATVAALRAVLAIHVQSVNDATCVGCWEAGGYDGAPLFPCPTVRAITEALDGTS